MSTYFSSANCSMMENDRAPRLCGSSSAKCRPYRLSDETMFAIASTAGQRRARNETRRASCALRHINSKWIAAVSSLHIS
jgi:hypothetical protein